MNMKRYEKYKPSGIDWIGEVPEHWDVMKLLYCLRQPICDGPHETPNLVENGVPFISIDSLNDTKEIDLTKASKFISEEDYRNYMKKAKLENGDVLFTKAATIGKTAIVGDEHFMVWSPLAILKSKGTRLSNLYLYYLLNCQRLVTSIVLSGSYNTQINVGMREMEKAYITVPSLAEQEAIAAYLDARCADIDKVVATQQKRIALLQELKQSEITQAVTCGLNPDARMKDSGVEWIGMVPEHWEVIPFKSKFKTDKGLSITKADLVDEGVPVISYGQIHSKQNDYVHTLDHLLRFIPEEMVPADSKAKLEIGDIVFADTSEDVEGSGNAFYIDREGIYAGYHTVIAKSIERVDNKYFAYLFATPVWRSQVRSQVYGVKVFSITQQILKSTSLIAPPVEERKQIVEVLEEKCARIDKQIEKIQNQIELLREYKQALITEVVTGKRKV